MFLKRSRHSIDIADKYNAKFVTLQEKFDNACKIAPAEYWLTDGVHPTTAVHKIITEAWLEAFNSLNL